MVVWQVWGDVVVGRQLQVVVVWFGVWFFYGVDLLCLVVVEVIGDYCDFYVFSGFQVWYVFWFDIVIVGWSQFVFCWQVDLQLEVMYCVFYLFWYFVVDDVVGGGYLLYVVGFEQVVIVEVVFVVYMFFEYVGYGFEVVVWV